MDYYRVSTNRLEFKDLQKSQDEAPQHSFANVVLIDKTNHALPPILYRLKEDSIAPEDIISAFNSHGFRYMQEAEFIFIGPIATLDKKGKQIALVDKNFVTYNHLIIASSQRSSSGLDKEFSAGMQALMHALSIRSKIPPSFPSSFEVQEFETPQNVTLFDSKRTLQKDIEKVAHPHMQGEDQKNYGSAFASSDVIFEVQI